MKLIIGFFLIMIFISCKEKEVKENTLKSESGKTNKLEVLLLGTFHFANFNPENNGDVVQVNVRDILTDENQKELEAISDKIKTFNPDKIFVEYPYQSQSILDSIFSSFSTDNYKNVKRSEITQLAFRTAKKLDHQKLYAIDYRTDFPYDSLLTQMEKAKQNHLIAKDSLELEKLEMVENELFASNKSLTDILYYYNNDKRRKEDINWYVNLANQGGERDNFVGAYLASEWYKRNLYMYSLVQKSIDNNDDRILILAGASHIAMFKDFIDYNPNWKTVELKEIMDK